MIQPCVQSMLWNPWQANDSACVCLRIYSPGGSRVNVPPIHSIRLCWSMRGDPRSLKLGEQSVSLPCNRVLGNCASSGCHLWECFPLSLSSQPCLASWEHSSSVLRLWRQYFVPIVRGWDLAWWGTGSTRYGRDSGWRLPGHLDGNPALSFEASPRFYGKALSSSSGSDTTSSPSMTDNVT